MFRGRSLDIRRTLRKGLVGGRIAPLEGGRGPGSRRRSLLSGALVAASLLGWTLGALAAGPTTAVFIGTYTGGKSEGIYLLGLDLESGKLTPRGRPASMKDPSYLALSPSGHTLYAVSEVGDFEGVKTGAVCAFRVQRDALALTPLGCKPSGGAGPCHLIVDSDGKHVLVANYGAGSVAAFAIDPDGSLGARTSHHQHEGSSVNPGRQEGPHAHDIVLDPAGKHVLVCDLGLDKVLVYDYDAAGGVLTPADPPFAEVAKGSGPRHLSFRPDGRFVYVINELSSTLTAFRHSDGKLAALQTLSTLPPGGSSGNSTAEVVVDPSGRFVYGSNRGHDSIAVFSIDPERGTLTLVEHASTQGKTPRSFGIDPSGRYLLALNQGSDSIVVFRRSPETGKLQPTGVKVEVPAPVSVQFLPLKDSNGS